MSGRWTWNSGVAVTHAIVHAEIHRWDDSVLRFFEGIVPPQITCHRFCINEPSSVNTNSYGLILEPIDLPRESDHCFGCPFCVLLCRISPDEGSGTMFHCEGQFTSPVYF